MTYEEKKDWLRRYSKAARLESMKFDEVARYAVAMGRACARLAGTEMASLKKVYEVYETTQVYVL